MEELTAFVSKSFDQKSKETSKESITYKEVLESGLARARELGNSGDQPSGDYRNQQQPLSGTPLQEHVELDKEKLKEFNVTRATDGEFTLTQSVRMFLAADAFAIRCSREYAFWSCWNIYKIWVTVHWGHFIILKRDFDRLERLTSMRVEKCKLYSADAMGTCSL